MKHKLTQSVAVVIALLVGVLFYGGFFFIDKGEEVPSASYLRETETTSPYVGPLSGDLEVGKY